MPVPSVFFTRPTPHLASPVVYRHQQLPRSSRLFIPTTFRTQYTRSPVPQNIRISALNRHCPRPILPLCTYIQVTSVPPGQKNYITHSYPNRPGKPRDLESRDTNFLDRTDNPLHKTSPFPRISAIVSSTLFHLAIPLPRTEQRAHTICLRG
jgi:hypothetical protein